MGFTQVGEWPFPSPPASLRVRRGANPFYSPIAIMTKQDILGGAPALPVEIVETPEWPNSPKTRVRMMTGTERDSFVDVVTVAGGGNKDNFRAKFLVRCICDEAGARIFADDDATALGQQPHAVIFRLFTKAWALNGMADAEQLAGN